MFILTKLLSFPNGLDKKSSSYILSIIDGFVEYNGIFFGVRGETVLRHERWGGRERERRTDSRKIAKIVENI
jgi:hypothetical protein